MNSNDEVRTLKRGLQILDFLVEEGPATITSIAQHLDIPRANVHRMVMTMTAAGYCRKVPGSFLYNSSLGKRATAAGASMVGIVTAVSMDLVEELGRVIEWPVEVDTAQDGQMITRLSTSHSTRLALDRITPGCVTNLFYAATGVICLAFAGEALRERLLTEAADFEGADDQRIWKSNLDVWLTKVKEQGYFILLRKKSEASIAVPIMLEGEPVAGLSMRYLRGLISYSDVVKVYVPRLRTAALEIERALRAVRDAQSFEADTAETAKSHESPIAWASRSGTGRRGATKIPNHHRRQNV